MPGDPVPVVLLHSALGLRPAVHEHADRLRAAGHAVHAPDLYDGVTFGDTAAGLAHRDAIGWRALQARADAALPEGPLALVGLSMGVVLATRAAARRPDVRGALLLHAAAPYRGDWPGVPVEVHHTAGDPFVEPGGSAALVEQVARSGARASLHVYPGGQHLFTDPDLDEHLPEQAELLWTRALAFLAGVG